MHTKMAREIIDCIAMKVIAVSFLLCTPIVYSDDTIPVPEDASQLNSWFDGIVTPLADRKATLDPNLVKAESQPPQVIKMKCDGSGDFKTFTDAIKSIPDDNTKRIIISIAPGNYTEKIRIGRYKPFITFYGEDPINMPVLVFGGTAREYTIVESATLIVDSDYFTAINLKIVNSAPRPDGKMVDAQAAALRIGGDKAAFYNCRFHGFQDTLCDDRGKHLYKDCYIEGTVDFIFGSGRSVFLNSEIHVIPGDGMAFITAQARSNNEEDTGYSFLHCKITGTGGNTYLGRSWKPSPRVVIAYTEISDVIIAEGWSIRKPEDESSVFFGELNNKGPGANLEKRKFTKHLTGPDANRFIGLGFIEASKWLLPPTKL